MALTALGHGFPRMMLKALPHSKTLNQLGAPMLLTRTMLYQCPRGVIVVPFATLTLVVEGSRGDKQWP